MRFYAHTAEAHDGTRMPERSGRWQPLSEHLRNVASLLGRGIVVRNREAEAEGRNEVFELTADGYTYIGRTAPKLVKAKVEQELTRSD